MKALISIPDRTTRTAALARLAFAKLRAKSTRSTEEEVLKRMRGGEDVLRVINKDAAADPATTGQAGFAAELMQTTYGEFLGWLAPGSAAARLFGLGLTVQMRSKTFKAPARDTAPAALPWVGESNPIPVRSMTLLGVDLTPRKMAAMSVISREAAKYGAEAAITTMLREDGEKGLDAGYFSTETGDDEIHPGLLAGLSAIPGYGGGDEVAFQEDVSELLAVVAPNGSNNIVFVTGQTAAQRIGLKFPDFRSPVFASQAVADTRLIAVDAGALVHAFGDFDIDIATDAIVHMEQDPADVEQIGDSGTLAGGSPVRSLFQTDSYGVRIIGHVAFAGRKANVAAYVDNPTW